MVFRPGLLPCISMYTLKILMEKYKPSAMESTRKLMLSRICHKGISVTPSLSMFWIGAVTGKRVKITEKAPLGNIKSKVANQRGTKLNITYIMDSWPPSLAVGVMAPTPMDSTAKSKYPRMKYSIPKRMKLPGISIAFKNPPNNDEARCRISGADINQTRTCINPASPRA